MSQFRIKRRRTGRTIQLNPETVEALKRQEQAFIEKFGREPGPGDPIFFDPDKDTPQPLEIARVERDIVEVMGRAGIDPAKIYAFKRCGFMLTEINIHLFSRADIQQWNTAVDDYQRSHGVKA